jgi:hypothetical protein
MGKSLITVSSIITNFWVLSCLLFATQLSSQVDPARFEVRPLTSLLILIPDGNWDAVQSLGVEFSYRWRFF